MFAVYSLILFSFYRPQRSCDKVMFLHLSVILFTGRLADPPLGRHAPWADTNQADNPRHTPWAATPGQTPPWEDILPYAQCLLGYGQEAGGTHPTGMHSCSLIFFRLGVRCEWALTHTYIRNASWVCDKPVAIHT